MRAHKASLRLNVLSPCPEDWDQMAGDDRIRFCGRCCQNVYSLSAMTEAEVRALVLANENPVCVRIIRRGDGTVVTRSCPPMLSALRRRAAAWAVSLAALAAGFWGGVLWLHGLVHPSGPLAPARPGRLAPLTPLPTVSDSIAPPPPSRDENLPDKILGGEPPPREWRELRHKLGKVSTPDRMLGRMKAEH